MYVVHEIFIEVSLSPETCSPPGCAPVTFNVTFYPNFHSNILVFANLQMYRKLVLDNISLAFEIQESFTWYYFEGDIKYCLYI